MARKRNPESAVEKPERGMLEERRRFFAAAFLVAAVVAVLVLGLVLRTDAPFEGSTERDAYDRRKAVPATAVEGSPLPAEAVPEATDSRAGVGDEPARTLAAMPGSVAKPAGDSLEARAELDLMRLIGSGGNYTVQLSVHCDPDNVRRVLLSTEDAGRVYLLPMTLSGKPCYRLCWGSYGSRLEAQQRRDLPATLRSRFPKPLVKPIYDLRP